MSSIITFQQKGDFKKIDSFLEKALEIGHLGYLNKYGRKGVEALAAATPSDSGETANSWYYEIKREKGETRIIWCNGHRADNTSSPLAVILQYGHATKNGYWVEGIDYINPAIQPIFDEIAEEAWKEVTR